MLSAKYDAFPQLKLSHMPEILSSVLGIYPDAQKCRETTEQVLQIYNEFRADVLKSDYTLSRVLLIELLLVFIKFEIEQGQATNYADTLSKWTTEFFTPYVYKNQKVEDSLTMFRKELVWTNEVNMVFHMNTEGLIRVFNEYMHPLHGFDFRVATKVLQDCGYKLDVKLIKQSFDLAQMTVFDELTGAGEYSDMEFEEFLEFLVRIAY